MRMRLVLFGLMVAALACGGNAPDAEDGSGATGSGASAGQTSSGPSRGGGAGAACPCPAAMMQEHVDEAERRAIEQALVAAEGHRARAAEILGVSKRTLQHKLANTARTQKPLSDTRALPSWS